MTYLMWLIEQAEAGSTKSTRYSGGVHGYTEFGAFLQDVMDFTTEKQKLYMTLRCL